MKVFNIVSTISRINSPMKKSIQARSIASKLDVVKDASVISALKSYYSSVAEKLNDIYLERKRNRQSTYIVENNIDSYEKLPAWLQKTLKPSDVGRDGHMNQGYIKGLWEAGQEAERPGVYGRCPIFKGEAGADAIELPELEIDAVIEAPAILSDVVEDNVEALASLSNVVEASDVLENIDVIDKVVDIADGNEVVAKVLEKISDIVLQ